MKKLIPFLFLFGCAGSIETSNPTTTVLPTMACDSASPKKCNTDIDCACGTDIVSGACAYGTAACIDMSKQCPDFCSGITGTMRLSCDNGSCVQMLGQKLGAPAGAN